MSLLQISEPGATPAPHQRRLGIGIDLGTTHSLVAAMRHSLPECLPNAQGRTMQPSAVHYGDGALVQTGDAALQTQASDPLNTITSVKRLMGRSLHDIQSSQGDWQHYDLVADDPQQGMVRIRTRAGDKSPVEVSAEILSALRAQAQSSLAGDIDGVVITVPAYFDDAQRQATKDAAQFAVLPLLRLLNETNVPPTA